MTIGNAISLIKLAIPIGLLLGLLWFKHDARTAHMAFDRLKTEYIADSQMAALKQIASNQALEAHWRTKAEETDHAYRVSLDAALRRSRGYIAAHVVRPQAERASGATDPLPVASGAEGDNGPGAGSVLVAVTADDVNICTENTARLLAAHNAALSQ